MRKMVRHLGAVQAVMIRRLLRHHINGDQVVCPRALARQGAAAMALADLVEVVMALETTIGKPVWLVAEPHVLAGDLAMGGLRTVVILEAVPEAIGTITFLTTTTADLTETPYSNRRQG